MTENPLTPYEIIVPLLRCEILESNSIVLANLLTSFTLSVKISSYIHTCHNSTLQGFICSVKLTMHFDLQDISWLFPERLGFAPPDLLLKIVAVTLFWILGQYQLHNLMLCLGVPMGWIPAFQRNQSTNLLKSIRFIDLFPDEGG